MKENVLDVLLYLFEHYIHDESGSEEDRDSLQASLIEAGFSPSEISKAFDWLDDLSRLRPSLELSPRVNGPLRVYADAEVDRLDAEARGFLMFLEAQGILDPAQRELVLDRVMALEQSDIDIEDLKWVILMVLFNQPGQEDAYAWMENLVFDPETERPN